MNVKHKAIIKRAADLLRDLGHPKEADELLGVLAPKPTNRRKDRPATWPPPVVETIFSDGSSIRMSTWHGLNETEQDVLDRAYRLALPHAQRWGLSIAVQRIVPARSFSQKEAA